MLELSQDGSNWCLGYGGDTLNTAIHLARAGVKTAYLTALGTDPFSADLKARWAAEGLDTGLVLSDPARNPGLYAITCDEGGERSFTYWRGESAARQMFACEAIKPALNHAAAADILGFSLITLAILPETGRLALLNLARTVADRGGMVVFDGNYRSRLWPDRAEAMRCRDAVIAAVAAPTTHIVSLTVTEKGYCRTARGDLDFEQAHSLSFYYFVTQALLRRRNAGLPGVTLLPCDNLADNGAKLHALMGQYLARHEPDLVAWFEANCTCPSTMIDRIVPATTDEDRAGIAQALGGLQDDACVVTEPFSQWVIEDKFAGPRPKWEAVGAQLVADVAPYETAKLRMLNGAHSLLAYCGLKAGYTYVHEAVADPALHHLAETLMRQEAAPTITPAPNQNLAAYADALIARFANPALNHRLIQIAMDGSQKIPQRWLETLAENAAQGRQCPAILQAIAAWLHHLTGANGPVDDPLAEKLTAIVNRNPNPHDAATALFTGTGPLAGTWQPTAADRQTHYAWRMDR